jgi:hypothetical protein
MPEVDRAEKIHMLAAEGMGWNILEEEEPVELRLTHPPRPPKLYVYRKPGERVYLDHWHPDRDWGPAGELLMKLGTRDSDVWSKFCQRLLSMVRNRTGPDLGTGRLVLPRDVLAALASSGPALIAQAACEALEASHDAG